VEHLVLLLREIVLSAHDDDRRSVGKAHVLSPHIMPGLQAEARSSVWLISQRTRAHPHGRDAVSVASVLVQGLGVRDAVDEDNRVHIAEVRGGQPVRVLLLARFSRTTTTTRTHARHKHTRANAHTEPSDACQHTPLRCNATEQLSLALSPGTIVPVSTMLSRTRGPLARFTGLVGRGARVRWTDAVSSTCATGEMRSARLVFPALCHIS
jgi:hypothetical protein